MSHRPPSAVVCRPPVIDPSRAWQLLVNWARASEAWWYDLPGRPGMGHYGTGYNHWGLHTTPRSKLFSQALSVYDQT